MLTVCIDDFVGVSNKLETLPMAFAIRKVFGHEIVLDRPELDAVAHGSHEWIFSLDADERSIPQAREEILLTIRDPHAADAYLVPRRNRFMGRWIRHSGWYPGYRQHQLFARGSSGTRRTPCTKGTCSTELPAP